MLAYLGLNENAAEFVENLLRLLPSDSLSIMIISPGKSVVSSVFIATEESLEGTVRDLALSFLLEPMPTSLPITPAG